MLSDTQPPYLLEDVRVEYCHRTAQDPGILACEAGDCNPSAGGLHLKPNSTLSKCGNAEVEMRVQRAVVSLLLFCCLEGSSSTAGEAKKRVALLDFDFGTVQRWWSGNWDIGKGVADLVVTGLVKDGTYSVIERKKLDTILQAIVINVGKGAGVTLGMRLAVERPGREIKDPATGKVLRKITAPVGEIEVKEVDEVSAVAKGFSGQGFKVGDIVK